jgi:thioredoxin reductase (NADPH)
MWIVVGANNSTVDAALEAVAKNWCDMLSTQRRGGKQVKYWVKPDIENRIREDMVFKSKSR